MNVRDEIIHLHHKAPPKPAEGLPCNGCGVCCALETCPAARLRFLQKRGPCPALQWSATELRYHCGFLSQPQAYFSWLPKLANALTQRLFYRWISAGKGCDCSAETTAEMPENKVD
jgi:hypothetical protein